MSQILLQLKHQGITFDKQLTIQVHMYTIIAEQ